MEKNHSSEQILKRRITRRNAIKAGGVAALGLAFSKPLIQSLHPRALSADSGSYDKLLSGPPPGGGGGGGCDTDVDFAPIWRMIPDGGCADVTANITKVVSKQEADEGQVKARLVDRDWLSAPDVLAQAAIALPAGIKAGDCVTVSHTFTLCCSGGKVVGSGERSAELRIMFPGSSKKYGWGKAICI